MVKLYFLRYRASSSQFSKALVTYFSLEYDNTYHKVVSYRIYFLTHVNPGGMI